MKNLFVLLLLLNSLVLVAQEQNHYKTTLNTYISKLSLDTKQVDTFTLIFNKYNEELHKDLIDKQKFNKANKLRDIEIHNMLSKEQFALYKKLKLELEPKLKYRFE